MVARRPAAIATIAVAALAAGAARASADALVYRCGANVCKSAPNGTGKQRLTTDGRPGGPLYSWVSASADGSRLAVVNATYAYVLDGRGRRLTGKLPRGGIDVIAEIAPSGAQVSTVELLPEVTPAPVGSPPGTPGLSGFVPYMFVMNADGSAREATARSVIDIGWLGQRLVRTDRSDADPFPYGICVLATNTDFECGSDAARDPTQDLFNPAFSSDGAHVAVVKSPSTTIGAGAIVIYDVATGAPVRELVAGENTQPTWSPNGKLIAFERGGDIYVARATGAPREHRVLKGGEQPSWTSAAACRAAPPARPRARGQGARQRLRGATRAPDRHAPARRPPRRPAHGDRRHRRHGHRAAAEPRRRERPRAARPRQSAVRRDTWPAMSQENVEWLREVSEARVRDDAETLEALLRVGLAADFELQALYPDRVYKSAEGMRGLREDALETWADYRFETEEIVDLGKHVLVHARITGRGAASGVPIDQPVAVLVAFEGEKAIWAKSFRSKNDALEAAGL